ncbi:S41 family peptidase [Streptomyces syringium]|uniref:S41 family peptidase n=2 Tax=Streptomyces syringium TaxID=76729 RepID=UPI0037D12025
MGEHPGASRSGRRCRADERGTMTDVLAEQMAGQKASAREYLVQVLDLLQHNALNRERVDWERLRREAFARTAEATSAAETHGVIREAIEALGDPHTFFLSPEDATEAWSESATRGAPVPTGHLIDGLFGYLAIPEASGAEEADQRYVQAGVTVVRDLDAHAPTGWVVDLRGNTGGNMFPMITVLAPLLGEGHLGSFVDADGEICARWTLREGVVHVDDEGLGLPPHPRQLSKPTPLIAILTDARTMSAAEATLISFLGLPNVRTFGAPTAGLATGNEAIDLSDGAVLVLTAVREADRTGRLYGNEPIAPHQPVPPGEDALAAATDWLAARAEHRPPTRGATETPL